MNTDELKILRDKCLIFNQFMIEERALPSEMAKFYDQSNALIEKAYKEGDIKPLKSMSSDIDNQILKHMPIEMALKLRKKYQDKLGINFDIISKVYSKAVEKILIKRKISSPAEYELLLNRVDEIYFNPAMEDEVKMLNNLLSSYKRDQLK